MLEILKHSHSGLRWIVLLLLVSAIFKNLLKWRSNAPYTEADRQLNLVTMVVAHVQLLVGIVLYFISPMVEFGGETMSNSTIRFYTIEHFVMMVLAIVLITAGHTTSKKAVEEAAKFKAAFIFYLVALVIILAAIPWPFRAGLGGGWF